MTIVFFWLRMGFVKKLIHDTIGTKGKNALKLLFSAGLGLSDYVFDIIVTTQFFLDGDYRYAACMIATILFGGCASLFGSFMTETNVTWVNFFPLLLGLGFMLEFVKIVYSNHLEVNEQFVLHRIAESLAESIPSGAFQLYVLYTEDEYTILNVLSICFSALGLGFGVLSLHSTDVTEYGNKKSVAYLVKMYWRYWFAFWVYLSTDFFLRSSAITLILTTDEFQSSEPIVWIPIVTFTFSFVSFLLIEGCHFLVEFNVTYTVVVAFCSFFNIFSVSGLEIYLSVIDEGNLEDIGDLSVVSLKNYVMYFVFNVVLFLLFFSYSTETVKTELLIYIVCSFVLNISSFIFIWNKRRSSDIYTLKDEIKHTGKYKIFEILDNCEYGKIDETTACDQIVAWIDSGEDLAVKNSE